MAARQRGRGLRGGETPGVAAAAGERRGWTSAATAAQTPAGPFDGWRWRRPSPGRAAGAQEKVATSLTRGWRTVETPSALARRGQPWWGPSPGCVGGKEGDRDRVLWGGAGRDWGAHCLGREGLTQETAAATAQHTVEASTTRMGWWGRRGPWPSLRRLDGARQRCPSPWRGSGGAGDRGHAPRGDRCLDGEQGEPHRDGGVPCAPLGRRGQ